jgi:hypothetical protein
MSEMVVADPTVLARDLSLERGVRLERLAGRILGALVLIIFALSLPLVRIAHLPLAGLLLGGIISDGLLWAGVWFAEQRQGVWSARLIVVGAQAAILAFQLVWAWGHGFDAPVLVAFTAYVIPIGLGSVLESGMLMFIAAGVTSAVSGAFLFLGPR